MGRTELGPHPAFDMEQEASTKPELGERSFDVLYSQFLNGIPSEDPAIATSSGHEGYAQPPYAIEPIVNYLREHPEDREVFFSRAREDLDADANVEMKVFLQLIEHQLV